MRDINSVLAAKEQQLGIVRAQVASLKIAIPLLIEESDTQEAKNMAQAIEAQPRRIVMP